MTTPAARRLPGFQFQVQPPPLAEALPRLDIAAFVGFAASGPLHTPVAVEDPSQFAAVFGADAPLAWDPQRGARVSSHLGPSVRAFFRNGGRRAWIVRVAGTNAAVNRFPVPGLARIDSAGKVAPAFARARSAGSWSDGLRVTAALLSESVTVSAVSIAGRTIDLVLDSPTAVGVGDLLRLGFNGGNDVLLATVATPKNGLAARPAPAPTRFVIHRAAWFRASWNIGAALPSGTARGFVHEASGVLVEGAAVEADVPIDPSTNKPAWPTVQDPTIRLTLKQSLADAPPPGALLRVDFQNESLWLRIEGVRATSAASSVLVNGQGLWAARTAPAAGAIAPQAGERLSFELWAAQGGGDPIKLTDLTFAPDHPSFWGALPADEALYRESDPAQAAAEASASAHQALWQAASVPRFPLAGDQHDGGWFVPIDMAIVPDAYLGPESSRFDALRRDGLATFDARLFLDPRLQPTPLKSLIEADTASFIEEADFLRYGLTAPPEFTGIYTLLDLTEATIVAVPDAVHRPWSTGNPAPMPPPIDAPPQPGPPGGVFQDCGLRALTAPVLTATAPDPTGTFTLSWTAATGTQSLLQEATTPDYSDAVTIASQPADRSTYTIYGRPPGDYYYRVSAILGSQTSDWSKGVGVRVAPAGIWQVDAVDSYTPDALLAVQRALLRMCAARGDLFAVLSLPEHDREDAAIAHAAELQSAAGSSVKAGGALVLPLSAGEARALSFGALYHPWSIAMDDTATGGPRWSPPDGFACGILALRTATRGAWVAPANQPWTGPVDLSPTIARGRLLDLQDARVNIVRQEPHGFVTLAADTLSTDDDLRPINVRRLLILLRRLALRLGATYVFEPNDASFRRTVRRGFESVLEVLFLRGAFAGDTRNASFQVVVTTTPQDVDAGRFVVELRVAPSLPLTFMTVRLIQTGDRGLVAEGT
jgi:hypothetical protein